jgi:hypothetical protein
VKRRSELGREKIVRFYAEKSDCFGLARPAVDAHTLGISSMAQLLVDCGFRVANADAIVCAAFNVPQDARNLRTIEEWIRRNRITVLGVSYRLDPGLGATLFARLVHHLKAARLLVEHGGPLRGLFFAGLPAACAIVRRQSPEVSGVFGGDESPAEALEILGVRPHALPAHLLEGVRYDRDRLNFGKELIATGRHRSVLPPERNGYPEFGTRRDSLLARLDDASRRGRLPLMRAHVGPYAPDREATVELFLQWCRELGGAGHLDILSIGTSQLTQSAFGEDWEDAPNGGGVPLNSPEEFAAVWEAARPMLVRTYAGTRHIPRLARMYEQTIHMAWHTLSLWWFCQTDGRGPLGVRENLRAHVETLKFIAASGKPFEPNVAHHFAFRGADDATYVASVVLAAKLAKRLGIRSLIFQNMLNTPKYTWGIQDLAKSRAALTLLRELEDASFHVLLQPRGGLDFFSPDLDKARAQLAAVTALMDDIEPANGASPELIHVVSYSEASHLADPAVVNESIQITRHALAEYRRLRVRGEIDNMARHPEVEARTRELLADVRAVVAAIERAIVDPYSAEGLYRVFAEGFLPVPYLWECRDEFARAVQWPTRLIRGSVKTVDASGNVLAAQDRMQLIRLARHLPASNSGTCG